MRWPCECAAAALPPQPAIRCCCRLGRRQCALAGLLSCVLYCQLHAPCFPSCVLCVAHSQPAPLLMPHAPCCQCRWSWAICTDTCAICRNNLYEPSIEYQANPTGELQQAGQGVRLCRARGRPWAAEGGLCRGHHLWTSGGARRAWTPVFKPRAHLMSRRTCHLTITRCLATAAHCC